jgi:LPS export ABC transporter protein LptC
MDLRIEYILLAVFSVLIISIFGFNPDSKEAVSSKGEREVEFKNFFVYNIKEDDTGRQMHSTEATKYKNYMNFKDVNLTDEQGHSIYSDNAIYKNNLLHMNENVHVSRDDGLDFFTNSLDYNLKRKEIVTQDTFLLEFNKSIIRGKNLEFYVNNKSISGYDIDASIWFVPEEK